MTVTHRLGVVARARPRGSAPSWSEVVRVHPKDSRGDRLGDPLITGGVS